MPDVSLVAHGTTGTLKYKSETITEDTEATSNFSFDSIKAADNVTIPDLMKAPALAPDGTGYDNDNIWINAEDERMVN